MLYYMCMYIYVCVYTYVHTFKYMEQKNNIELLGYRNTAGLSHNSFSFISNTEYVIWCIAKIQIGGGVEVGSF